MSLYRRQAVALLMAAYFGLLAGGSALLHKILGIENCGCLGHSSIVAHSADHLHGSKQTPFESACDCVDHACPSPERSDGSENHLGNLENLYHGHAAAELGAICGICLHFSQTVPVGSAFGFFSAAVVYQSTIRLEDPVVAGSERHAFLARGPPASSFVS